MKVPEHLWRFPTKEGRLSLAKRFNLPYSDFMQDWEWEVANPHRLDDSLEAYEIVELSEDERFSLMEAILQSFEELESPLQDDERWQRVLKHLDSNIELHIHTLWHWSDLDSDFQIASLLHALLERHRARFT